MQENYDSIFHLEEANMPEFSSASPPVPFPAAHFLEKSYATSGA